MTIEPFPNTDSAGRMEKLRALLRETPTDGMETHAVAELCERAVPGCTIDEIVAALRQTATEHQAEADIIEGKENRTSLNQTIPLTPELMASARAIIDYMEEDEWKSLTNCRREDFDNHIYKHITEVADAFGIDVRDPVFADEVEDDGDPATNNTIPFEDHTTTKGVTSMNTEQISAIGDALFNSVWHIYLDYAQCDDEDQETHAFNDVVKVCKRLGVDITIIEGETVGETADRWRAACSAADDARDGGGVEY